MIKAGYTPIIKPNKERWKGYWRHKARKLWNPVNRLNYRNREEGRAALVHWLMIFILGNNYLYFPINL